MPKTILTIGIELASEAAHYESLTSRASLLDWDIVLFRPEIESSWKYNADEYLGKLCLNDSSSFALKEATEHWRREIKQAVDTGKTVVVFLPPLEEVFVATGETSFSGTGRTARRNRVVELHSNYRAIPLKLSAINSNGSAIKLAPRGGELIAPYWKEFGALSEYKVLLPNDTQGACLLTRHGDRPVGAVVRSQDSSGSVILLPDIDFSPEHFIEEEGDDDENEEMAAGQVWSDEARKFAARMVSALVALDDALRSDAQATPEPAWAADATFALESEIRLRPELLESERVVEEAQRRKEEVLERLKDAGRLRALLFEKGKPLENAIVDALRLLGFTAEGYRDGASEFDVVFRCDEGRLLGEVEGKDSKAINVDKLRQLSMNIHEDLLREEVTEPAKGVLFGNGYRLIPPANREAQFTRKCISAACSSSTALISTADLYIAVQYLSQQPDDGYAKECRDAILSGVGLVTLAQPPKVLAVAALESTTKV